MDLTYPAETEQLRTRVRDLVKVVLPEGSCALAKLNAADQDAFFESWRRTMSDAGLLALSWPTEFGGAGLSLVEQMVVNEELVAAGLPVNPTPNDTFGLTLLGPTLMHWGTTEQKNYFLPRTLSGEVRWAQGYSEPEAGSDLFNLKTTGRIDDDAGHLVINGQKIWTTAVLTANWIFGLVRTEPGTAGAKGLSFVVIPCDQAGVEVRGIATMTGELEFGEVFFTDARTSLDNVVGGLGNGAKVALTLLGFERGSSGVTSALCHKVELRRLAELIRDCDLACDSNVRKRVLRCAAKVNALYCLALRALIASSHGEELGPQSSLIKLLASEYSQEVSELAMDVLGAAIVAPHGAPARDLTRPQPAWLSATSSKAWVEDYLNVRARTIYGGSSEIQRNTISEQLMGLPRLPRPQQGTVR